MSYNASTRLQKLVNRRQSIHSYFFSPFNFTDDWAGNIENAIAAALKKDGIEPPMPKLSKNISGNMDIYDKSDKNDYVEDIRRARKRKKREERENKKVSNFPNESLSFYSKLLFPDSSQKG